MGSYYWAKVWIEVLDDPKMGKLSAQLWRRTIEMVLIAKDTDKDGDLPSLDDMAWRLRTNAELLEAELTDLARVGIVENRAGGWHVTNFTKRQEAMTPAERTARHRERQKKQTYNEPVTSEKRDSNEPVTNRYTDKIRVDKNRVETDKTPSANGRDIFTETASKALVKWWLGLVGGAMPSDPNFARSKLYDPADQLMARLDGDIPEAKERLERKRGEMLAEGKTPKWLEAMVPYLVADIDKRKPTTKTRSPITDFKVYK